MTRDQEFSALAVKTREFRSVFDDLPEEKPQPHKPLARGQQTRKSNYYTIIYRYKTSIHTNTTD